MYDTRTVDNGGEKRLLGGRYMKCVTLWVLHNERGELRERNTCVFFVSIKT